MGEHAVEVEGLVRKFGDLTAVDGISFTVERGEVFGFLGPNGAGKTTTINMLCTLLSPTAGKAMVDGFDVVKNKREVRQRIGLVFQDPSLDDRLTANENLDFHAVVYAVPHAVREKRKRELLEMVDLLDRADDLVITFSGGMKRRLEIARGLLHHPRVLFLDEPTIGLDPQTRKYIWDYIGDLKRREDITIFLTTHYMEEAEHCDRIAIIDHGKIIALDTSENLKNMVGGDIIRIKTDDDARAEELLKERFGVNILEDRDCLCFEVERGEEFIPRLFHDFDVSIQSISLHRPTLDDVFLKLTGREIRDEEADGLMEMRRMVTRVRPPFAR
ncbi:ATP-binding cassette domain-containing protein [Candidatus Solincola tengchongensis]|uniref:ATP-binding cassette domain-containing protein n=1 Tax=Candidatus Solincola tengchongensis TaxID=2900693 RepID=UPI00257D6E15|nr:ATP-binding cassette domain-containing protein [Candidatus Solincola tengchongensis]